MDVSKVTIDDGRNCATLINLISKGKWELSGDDAGHLVKTKQWLQDLAMKMAAELKSKPSQPPPTSPVPSPLKIKSMGSTKKRK